MLLDEIASLGLADRTLVVISADHGEEFMERSGVGHGQTVHDELIRVPLVVRHPRGRLRGLVTEPFTTMHLFHLLLAAAGRDRPITDHEVTSRSPRAAQRTPRRLAAGALRPAASQLHRSR